MSREVKGKARWWSELGLGAAAGTIVVEKLAEWFFDTSLMSKIWSGIKEVCTWLQSDLPMPIGLVIGPLVLCLGLLWLASYNLRNYNRAVDEIETLRNPPWPRLSNAEHAVVMAVGELWNSEHSPTERDVRSNLSMTPLAVHAALDGLVSWKLIEPSGNRWNGFTIALTAKGRTYVQAPKSVARSNRRLG